MISSELKKELEAGNINFYAKVISIKPVVRLRIFKPGKIRTTDLGGLYRYRKNINEDNYFSDLFCKLKDEGKYILEQILPVTYESSLNSKLINFKLNYNWLGKNFRKRFLIINKTKFSGIFFDKDSYFFYIFLKELQLVAKVSREKLHSSLVNYLDAISDLNDIQYIYIKGYIDQNDVQRFLGNVNEIPELKYQYSLPQLSIVQNGIVIQSKNKRLNILLDCGEILKNIEAQESHRPGDRISLKKTESNWKILRKNQCNKPGHIFKGYVIGDQSKKPRPIMIMNKSKNGKYISFTTSQQHQIAPFFPQVFCGFDLTNWPYQTHVDRQGIHGKYLGYSDTLLKNIQHYLTPKRRKNDYV